MKCVLIGAGYIAKNHVDAMIKNPDVELVGVVCRNPEHARWVTEKVSGCKYYSTLEEAWKETTPDFVNITTPTGTHEEYVIKAAKLGCHVLCEKPITFTLESYDKMCKACNDAGVKFMVAQVVRFLAYPQKVKEMFDAGTLGNIHMLYEKRLCQLPTWGRDWHNDPNSFGGGLYDLHVHDIDFIYSMFGKPKKVYATGWKDKLGCWNQVATSLTWEDGKSAVCEGCIEMTGDFPFSVEMRIVGDNGTLHHLQTAGTNINDGVDESVIKWYPIGGKMENVDVNDSDGFENEVGVFVDAIKNNKEVPIKQYEIRDVLQIIIAAKKSLETKEVVEL